jgi:hypothetical protein
MSVYTNHGKTTSAKRNSGRKSTLTERGCRIMTRNLSKNHTTTAAQVREELNIYLADIVSTKIARRELHKSICGAFAKFLITVINAQMCKRWCHDHKNCTSDNWKL